jgi:hypothetical protein
VALPTIPATHKWIDGGAVIRYVGTSGVTGPGNNATMFCWDRDAAPGSDRVTDLYDQDGNPCTEVPVRDNTFVCAVPKTVAKPVFSVGQAGPRFAGNDWDQLDQVAAHVMGDDGVLHALDSDPASAFRVGLDARLNSTIAAAVEPKLDASKVKITDGGEAAGVGTGGPTRPNLQLGGVLNGTTIEPSQIHGVILQPGGPGYNNIIGGDGSATVGTSTPNTADATVGNCGVALIGGYDNVVGQISSKIISDHSYTERAPSGSTAPGHNLIMGGHGHVIRWAASHSAIVGGETLDVGGSDSLTTGFQNVNNGASSLVSGSSNTLAVSSGSTVSGQLNNVQTSYARVSGYSNTVDAVALFAEMHGANGKARSPFLTVRSAGQITAAGDAQNVAAQYRGQSTSATAILLIAAYTGVGSNSQYLMVLGQSALIKAEVVARIVGGATVGAWTIQGVAQWQTGAGAPVWLGGTPTPTALYTNGSGAAPALLLGAGGSAGRVFVQCAGVAATTINWSCKFTAVEVMA